MALYFPCNQNENNKIPQSVIDYSIENYAIDKHYILYGPVNLDPNYPNYYLVTWSNDGDIWGNLPNDNSNYFDLQKTPTLPEGFSSIEIGFISSSGNVITRGSNYNDWYTYPMRVTSSQYDLTFGIVTDQNFYDQNDNILVNGPTEYEKEGEDFVINNVWTHGTWTSNGLTGMQGQNFRQVKGRIVEGGRISFYKKEGIVDGSLQYGVIVNGSFDGLQYSEDGGNVWIDTNTFPYTFFYRERESELGEFNFGLSFYSQIPVFEDEEIAQKYVDEDPTVSIEDAINWAQISNQYPINNNTGSDFPETVFGEVYLKGHFSQQYILSSEKLTALANDLFDTSSGGIWEVIKKGLDMYGNSPIEAVMGLSWFPLDLTRYFKTGSIVSAQYIWFGGYGWDASQHPGSCSQIIYANGEYKVGRVRILPSFGNGWRDYEPYTKLYVSIPFCGTYQLDLARYLGKDVDVVYNIDTRTNGCIVKLIADGYLMDYFNGQIGVTMPITLTDYSAYANAQIQTLLQGGGQAVQSFGNADSAAQQSLPLGAGAAIGAGAISAGVSGAAVGVKTVYGLTMNNINNFNKTKGGSSSMLNCFLSMTVDFIFEVQQSLYDYKVNGNSFNPMNRYIDMVGLPSMKSGSINSFTGFLKCKSVKLECPTATENEREKIKQMLLSGIYI